MKIKSSELNTLLIVSLQDIFELLFGGWYMTHREEKKILTKWGKASGGRIQIQIQNTKTKYKILPSEGRQAVELGMPTLSSEVSPTLRWSPAVQKWPPILNDILFYSSHLNIIILRAYMIYHHFALNITIQYLRIIVLRLSIMIYMYIIIYAWW